MHCNIFFLFFNKIPGKIHENPKDEKDRNAADEIKFFSENGSKKLKNGGVFGSVKEEKVCSENFVKEIDRNGFAEKKQKKLTRLNFQKLILIKNIKIGF